MHDLTRGSLDERILRLATEELLELDALRPELCEAKLVIDTVAACVGAASVQSTLTVLSGHLVERTLLWQASEAEQGRTPRAGSAALQAVTGAMSDSSSIRSDLVALEERSRSAALPMLEVLVSDSESWSDLLTALGIAPEVLEFARSKSPPPRSEQPTPPPSSALRPSAPGLSMPLARPASFRVRARTATRLSAEPQAVGDRVLFQISGVEGGVDPHGFRPVILREVGADVDLMLPDRSGRWPALSAFPGADGRFDIPVRLQSPAGVQRFVVGVMPETTANGIERAPEDTAAAVERALRAGDLPAEEFTFDVVRSRASSRSRRGAAPPVATLRVARDEDGGWRLSLQRPGAGVTEALVPRGRLQQDLLTGQGELARVRDLLWEVPAIRGPGLILAVQADSSVAAGLPWELLDIQNLHGGQPSTGAGLTVVRLDRPDGLPGPVNFGPLHVTTWLSAAAAHEAARRAQGLRHAAAVNHIPEELLGRSAPAPRHGMLWAFPEHESELVDLRDQLIDRSVGGGVPPVLVIDPPRAWATRTNRLMRLLRPLMDRGVEACAAATRGVDDETQDGFRRTLLEGLAAGTPLALAVGAARTRSGVDVSSSDRPLLVSGPAAARGRFSPGAT